jgi:hypothetical protein
MGAEVGGMSIMGNQSLSQRTEIDNRQDQLYKVTMLSEKVRAIGSVLLIHTAIIKSRWGLKKGRAIC